MIANIKRLSLCQCGHKILVEGIPLGTEYEINPNDTVRMIMTCGGCGMKYSGRAVFAEQRGSSHGGYIPQGVFEDAGGAAARSL